MKNPLTALKQWLPKSLYGRSLLIVITPVVLLQAVTTYVFFDRHWSKVTQLLADDMAGSISACVELFNASNTPHEQLPHIQRFALNHFGLLVDLKSLSEFPVPKPAEQAAWREEILYPALEQRLHLPFYLVIDDFQIHIKVATLRGMLVIAAPTKQLFTRTTPIFIWWIVLTPIFLLIIAIAFLRNQVKPLKELSEIVDEFGKGREVRTLKPRGAAEVRKVARAFNAMKERINRQITQRSEMLAGVSHDLRTPLTRMELSLAMLEQTPEVIELHEDIREMAKMIDDYLAFAKGEEGEKPQLFDLLAMITKLRQKMGEQHIHIVSAPSTFMMTARPQAIQRCLANIFGNALRYAQNSYLTIESTPRDLCIIIEDDGPGIPESAFEDVFKPFYRLEHSRNQETGGSGLGLAIAKTIIQSHGGDIELYQSNKYKGLKVKIIFPL